MQEEDNNSDEPHPAAASAGTHPTPQVFSGVETNIQKLMDLNYNKNTSNSTSNWIRKFQEWTLSNGIIPKLEEIRVEKLDGVLERFYYKLKCKNGENYEPDSLQAMQVALDHHLKY